MKKKRNFKFIKLVRAGAKALRLDRDEQALRGFYERACGLRHISDMDNKDLLKVIRALRAEGFAAEDAGGVLKHKGVTLAQDGLSRKLRSIWLELRDAGALRDSSEAALLRYVKKRTRVDRLEWLADSQKVWLIEQLKAWLERVRTSGAGAGEPDEEAAGVQREVA